MKDGAAPVITDLRRVRRERGLSQAALAQRLGTTQSAVARLEAGGHDPRLSTVRRYAAAVGVDLHLGGGSGAPSAAATGRAVAEALRTGDLHEALRHVVQFLDDLDRATPADRQAALTAEPAPVGDTRWDALLAGVSERASHHYGLPVPGWTAAPSRFLTTFWFVSEDLLGAPAPGLAAHAFVDAAPELANRGVFLDRASLVSV